MEENQKRKRAAESRLPILRTEIQENESRLQKATMDIEFCTDQCQVYTTQLQELKANRVTVDPKAVESLERKLKDCQETYNQVHAGFSKSESAVQKLDDQIRAMGADKVEAQQSTINSVKKKLEEVKDVISKANVSLLLIYNNWGDIK